MYWHERDEHEPRRRPRAVSATPPAVAPLEWDTFTRYLTSRGLSADLAVQNRWYPSTSAGDRATRIVIPATTTTGVGFWQARAVDPTEPKRYQSPPVPRGDAVVLVYPVAVPIGVVVCEGPMCALAAAECGYLGVALMGNTPTLPVIEHVAGIAGPLPMVVVADTDALGPASVVAAQLAARGRRTRVVCPRGAKDLAELSLDERKAQLHG